MVAPLLTTKLYIPPLRSNLVPRLHLIEQLDEGLHPGHRLTLVSAPAGFGKTTLVSEWLHQGKWPFTWLSLDDGDNDSTRFLAYLVAALQEIDGNWGRVIQTALCAPQLPPPTVLLAALINEIATDGPDFILALDDYHVIINPSIHDMLAFLLDNLPPQMHLVIMSRADPPLPLSRLRAHGELIEIRADALRFTAEEAVVFLNEVMGLNMTSQQIARLEARTEGWVAGLQLAALSLQGLRHGEDIVSFVEAFAGSHRYVMDYLIEEVFNRQPPQIQEFLLQTSILDRLCRPLCDALTGQTNGQEMLERLERANLFLVPLDHHRRWYRYHHLFADLLRDRLQQTRPDAVPALHRQASEWYEGEGLVAEAFHHALAANDIERATCLAEDNARHMVRRGELTTLLRWLSALPEEVVRSRPRLCVNYAWALLMTGRADAVEPCLRDAEKALARRAASPPMADEEREIAALRGEVALTRLFLARIRDDLGRTIERSQQNLEQMNEENPFVRGLLHLNLGIAFRRSGEMAKAAHALAEAVRLCQAAGNTLATMIATNNLAWLYEIQGQLRRAAEIRRQVLQSTEECGGPVMQYSPGLGVVHLGLAHSLYEWNELEVAEQHVQEGIALGEPGGYVGVLVNGYRLLARLRQARGDVRGALAAIHKLERAVRQRNAPQATRDEVAAYQAALWLAQGNVEAASRWAEGVEVSPDDHLDTLGEFKAITLARVLLAQAKPDEAEPLIERLLQAAESEGRMGKVVEILALHALARQAHGDTGGTLASLKRALTLAEPEGYVRTFVDEGTPMAALLRQALVRGIAPRYVGRLLAAFGEPAAAQPLPEPLTGRELEVLRLIVAGLTNQEIADQLVISVATVKRHITNIYGKLGVSHRTQAVARAQELDLL
jgi:LuxR family maltose regulon positive regulatory protein